MRLGEYELLTDYWLDLNEALRYRPKVPVRGELNQHQIRTVTTSGDLAISAVFKRSRLTNLRTSENLGTKHNIATKLDFAEEVTEMDKRITGYLLVTGTASQAVSGLLVVETSDIPMAQQEVLNRGVELLLTDGQGIAYGNS